MSDREIYDELRVSLMRFAASLVGPDEAGDVVSEAVVATLRRRSLSSLEKPGPYLMQAVLNTARSRGRRRSREKVALARHVSMAPDVQVVAAEPSEVTEAVAGLPPMQRAAVFLVYWEDLQPSQAAEVLGVRPATLRRYLHLARSRLKGYLDE